MARSKRKNTTPASGGPQTDVGALCHPQEKGRTTPASATTNPKKVEGYAPSYAIRVDVHWSIWTLWSPTKDGQTIPNLKKDNFRVFEDGVPQTINNFGTSDAPITAALLVKFASTSAASWSTVECLLRVRQYSEKTIGSQ